MRLAFLVTSLSFVIASTAFSSTIYIDGNATGIVNDGANWCDAYLTLQDALAAAEASGGTINEIRVANGTYKPDQGSGQMPGDRTATFQLLNGVTIAGGYAGCGAAKPNARDIAENETILSGDLAGNDVAVPNIELPYEPTRNENSYHVVVGSLTDATATLDGFTITDGNANVDFANLEYGAGMYNSYGSPTVLNCTFSQNSSLSSGGIYNYRSSPTITNCIIRGNSAYGGYYTFPCGGIYNDSGSSPTITNCVFINNNGVFGGGMINTGYSHAIVNNCTFYGNIATDDYGIGGIKTLNHSSVTVTNSILWGNFPHEILEQSQAVVTFSDILGGYPGDGNIDSNPLFFNADDGDLRVRSESPCIDSGNNDAVSLGVDTDLAGEMRYADHGCAVDSGNGSAPIVDMGAYELQQPAACGNGACDPEETCETCACDCGSCCGDDVCTFYESCLTCPDDCPCQTILVPGDYDKIQDAIEASLEGDEIVVAPGIYFESLNFLGKAFTLRSSHGPGVTTIDATGLNASVITCNLGEDANTSLVGFTIKGGYLLYKFGYAFDDGGGMHISHSSPIVSNCIFTENTARYGGGVYNSHDSHPSFIDCSFEYNNASKGGGLYNGGSLYFDGSTYDGGSKSTIRNCTFYKNSGSGMYNVFSNPTVANCAFTMNSDSGMHNDTSSPLVTNCKFIGNKNNNDGGGLYNFRSTPTFTNCAFIGNTARYRGGGIYNDYSSPEFTNCTICRNSALIGGGMSNVNSSNPTIINSILWLDISEIDNATNSIPTVSYTNIKYGYIGQGNINATPKFIRSPTFGLDRVWGTDDDDYGDLRLQPGSPSINTGDPAIAFTTGETDMHGLPRVLCDRVDMGAHEFAGDYDCNLKIDLKDVAGFQTCFTGENQGPYNSGCESMDFDGDLDIDRQDFTLFEQVFSPIPNPPRS